MFRHLTVLLLIATAWPLRVFAADPLSLADAVRIAAEQAPRLDASAAAIYIGTNLSTDPLVAARARRSRRKL